MKTHNWHTPECQEDCGGCMWCAGGLQTCKTCGAFEGATPDHCPREPFSNTYATAIHQGRLNYRDGYWRFECAQVMRPTYDLENWMAEQGYYPGQPHPISGNPNMGENVMQNVMHISEILAETFRHQPTPENLTAWVDSQPIPGQQELPLLFCDEVNSEFRSNFHTPPHATWCNVYHGDAEPCKRVVEVPC